MQAYSASKPAITRHFRVYPCKFIRNSFSTQRAALLNIDTTLRYPRVCLSIRLTSAIVNLLFVSISAHDELQNRGSGNAHTRARKRTHNAPANIMFGYPTCDQNACRIRDTSEHVCWARGPYARPIDNANTVIGRYRKNSSNVA